MSTFLVAVLSVGLSVAAQFLLKSGMQSGSVKAAFALPLSFSTALAIATSPALIAGFAVYGLSAIVWLKVLAQWDVSKAYPLVGMGFILTVVLGYSLGEQVTWLRAVGVLFIAWGVVLVASS